MRSVEIELKSDEMRLKEYHWGWYRQGKSAPTKKISKKFLRNSRNSLKIYRIPTELPNRKFLHLGETHFFSVSPSLPVAVSVCFENGKVGWTILSIFHCLYTFLYLNILFLVILIISLPFNDQLYNL
jgi:hypothetical protein